MPIRPDAGAVEIRYEQVRILLKDGKLSVHLRGGDFVDAELVQVFCEDSLDLRLPLKGTIRATFTTD